MARFLEENVNNFINCYYALNIELEKCLANYFLNNDLSRIIYSGVDYSLRKRASMSEYNNLDLPFMYYKMVGMERGHINRSWANQPITVEGMFIPEAGFIIKLIPVTITYEMGIFYNRMDETLLGMSDSLWWDSAETCMKYILSIKGNEFSNIANIDLNPEFDPQYTEQDWLEKNKIHSIIFNPTVSTFLIRADYNVSIPETIIIDFVRKKKSDIEVKESSLYLSSYFNDTI